MIIPIYNLIESLAESIDLISREVQNHHRRVAIIAHYLGVEMGLPPNRLENLVIASALHDVGGLTSRDRLDLLTFEENPGHHAEYGYRLLLGFRHFAHVAPFIRYHHVHWNNGMCVGVNGEPIPEESQIIYLADRIAVLMPENFQLGDAPKICARVEAQSGSSFRPDLVRLFTESLAQKECFWLDARDSHIRPMLRSTLTRGLNLSDEDLLSLGKLYSQIIDFRSSFTATHSSGVSAVAAALADLMRFSTQECLHMRLAGYLHDIGKLIVPESILEKDGPLTPEEFEIIRSHSYYSDRLLMNIKEFDTIRTWGALHHERLNGKGYPFRMSGDQLPLGSRIMAVADVFVALSEDRPYRAGMEKSAALAVLDSMTKAGTLDGKIVQVLVGGFDQINDQRLEAQNNARLEYSSFYTAASA